MQEFELGHSYKLINKEGFLEYCNDHLLTYEEYFDKDVFKLDGSMTVDTFGNVYCRRGTFLLMHKGAIQFLREVEIPKFSVGDLVFPFPPNYTTIKEHLYEIKLIDIDKNQYVISDKDGNLSIKTEEQLHQGQLSEKNIFLQQVLEKWKRSSLDYACDTSLDHDFNFEEACTICWEVMKEQEENK